MRETILWLGTRIRSTWLIELTFTLSKLRREFYYAELSSVYQDQLDLGNLILRLGPYIPGEYRRTENADKGERITSQVMLLWNALLVNGMALAALSTS
jgi:hypothetical protein